MSVVFHKKYTSLLVVSSRKSRFCGYIGINHRGGPIGAGYPELAGALDVELEVGRETPLVVRLGVDALGVAAAGFA